MRADRFYVLGADGNPVKCQGIADWAVRFEAAEQIVKQEMVGASKISTIFLGINHNYRPDGPPILWETMVIEGPMAREMDRCAGTREQAEAMHDRMVQRVKLFQGDGKRKLNL